MEIIHAEKISKNFAEVAAVDNLSLRIPKGEIYGFLGLNGAGKTTTIRMLLGMVRPSSGKVWLNGKKVHSGRHDLWNSVGYLVETPYAYPELTVRENLEIVRRLRFLPDEKAVDSIIEKLRLDSYTERKAKNLSLGNIQRLGLAKSLIHHPELLILDEPTNGLDPAGIVEIRELLLDLAHNHGVTIFVSSHILGEVTKFATRIGIIHKGVLIRELYIDQLKDLRNRRLLIGVEDKNGANAILAMKGYRVKNTKEGYLELTETEAVNNPEKVNLDLVNAGFPPGMLKVEEEDLEAFFISVIESRGA